MPRFNTIFFDIGKTLLIPSPTIGETVANVVKREAGVEISPDEINDNLHLIDRNYKKIYEEDDNMWSEHERQQQVWLEGYRQLLEVAGITEDIEFLVNAIYNEFDHAHTWASYEGALSTIEELRARGFKLGVISNWGRGLEDLLGSMGYAPYFDVIVTSAEVGLHKPQPEIFKLALERIGSKAAESIHIGDHLVADVAGARAVGIHPVLITHAYNPQMVDLTNNGEKDGVDEIFSVPEILRLVESLNAEE